MSKILLNRRMTLAECEKIWNADFIHLREMAFFRAIYVTRYRPNELIQCDIPDLDRENHLLTARKVKAKYNPKTHERIDQPPKVRKLDDTTFRQFCKLISKRKAGAIFITWNGWRCHVTQFQRAITNHAKTLGIQKPRYITDGGKVYYLVSLTGLREAGERHEVSAGGDSLIAARCSDHTEAVQRKHYMGIDTEEIVLQQEKHHPFFKESEE